MKKLRMLFVFLLFLLAGESRACKCAEHNDLTVAGCKVYDLIFQGRVDSIGLCKEGYAIAYMSVEALFKGKSFSDIEVRYDCASDCQMNFAKGEEWIIYAQYFKYGKAEINFCSRSRKKISAGDDYYESLNHISYINELRFLNKHFGIQNQEVKEKGGMAERTLIQPTAYWKLWLLLISLLVMYVIMYLVKKMK